MVKSKRQKVIGEEKGFNFFIMLCLSFILLIIIYPLWYIVISSFSSGFAITQGRVFLWPVEFTLDGYIEISKHNLLPRSFLNTTIYTISGTIINVFATVISAYALSRKDLPGRSFISLYFVFTMWFSAGLVPTFLWYRDLGLVNTIWALILPGAITISHMVVTRSYFMNSVPSELLEAAKIDGCSDFRHFFQIALPLATPIIAVITLYYAVGHWNAFFNAMIYIQDSTKYPLQLVLRDILLTGTSFSDSAGMSEEEIAYRENLRQMLKFSVIVVGSIPMLILYPFIQKFFVAGLSSGAVKG